MLIESLFAIGIVSIAYILHVIIINREKYFEERKLKHRGFLLTMKSKIVSAFYKIDMFTRVQTIYDAIPDVP